MLFNMILKILMNIIPVLLAVAFITLMERKILGLMMIRLSPQKVSMMGIVQPLTDALKLANKECNTMVNSSMVIFSLISVTFLCSSLSLWSANMSSPQVSSIKNNILFFILILSLNSSMIIFMGWSSYSKFSLLGSIRCAAQTISYEAALMMLLVTLIWYVKSFGSQTFKNIEITPILILPMVFMLWLPTSLAEMNRTPYDFSESESELVSGFNTEFGSKEFSMIFLTEYSNIIFMMTMSAILFTGVLSSSLILIIWVLWIRSVLPRLRFDKLMMMAWKFLIPYSTIILATSLTVI